MTDDDTKFIQILTETDIFFYSDLYFSARIESSEFLLSLAVSLSPIS
jgi:hypothetical protein